MGERDWLEAGLKYYCWLAGGGLPASLMIKKGCDTLIQATYLPQGALSLIQPAVTALVSLSDVTGA